MPAAPGVKVVTGPVGSCNNTDSIWDAAKWRKSSRSSPSGDNCLEVAFTGDEVAVRDTKNPQAGTLLFTGDEWRAFIEGAKAGEFDQ